MFLKEKLERAMRFEPTTLTLASDLILSIYLILKEFNVVDEFAKVWTRAEHSGFTRQLFASPISQI